MGSTGELNENRDVPVSPETEFVFDTSTGISAEDQKEIVERINTIVQESRIAVTPETMTLKAARRGVAFPLLVNLGAVILLVGTFFALSLFHDQNDAEIRTSLSALNSVESRLIDEIRRNAAAQARLKEQEMVYINTRLADVDGELDRLSSEMEEKIRAKEAELRGRMNLEIEAERRRLIALNLPEATITQRMQVFETEKLAALNQELAAYRRQLNDERTAAEGNLHRLQEEYRVTLAELQSQRTQILESARRQEAELRSRGEERAREFNDSFEQNRREVSSSAAELSHLTDEEERSVVVEWQISGYYNMANIQIREDKLEEALATLRTMREFLDTPSIQNLRIILARKEMNVSIIDALSAMIDKALGLKQENTSIVQFAQGGFGSDELLRLINEAEESYAEGNIADSERLYQQALAYVPGIKRLHAYFSREPEAAGEAGEMGDFIVRGENLYAGRDYRGALNAYTAALAYFPQYRSQENLIQEHIRYSAYEAALAERRLQDAQNAAPLISRAGGYYASGRYQDAALSYLSVLERYPQSGESFVEAAAGLRRSLDAQAAAASAALTAARAAGAAPALTVSQDASSGAETEALKAQIAELRQVQAEQLRQQEERIRGEYANQSPVPGVTTLTDERYTRLVSLYQDYIRRDGAAISERTETSGIVQAKVLFDAFLASDPVNGVFPGIIDRVKRYDQAFTKAGHDDALMRAADFAVQLSTRRTTEDMERYLSQEIGRNGGDLLMRDYLRTLRAFIK
jgi:hypothetical protein